MNELVQRLSKGTHPVAVGGSQPSLEDFKQRVTNTNYVFIRFTETRGGTDLGLALDRTKTDLSTADFAAGQGQVHVEGDLVLNYEKVRCIADVDLATLKGSGYLVVREIQGIG